MIRNGYTNIATDNEMAKVSTEYKFGNTTYEVVTKFNLGGESLKDILTRLIKKEIHKTA